MFAARSAVMTWGMSQVNDPLYEYGVPHANTQNVFHVHPKAPLVYLLPPGSSQIHRIHRCSPIEDGGEWAHMHAAIGASGDRWKLRNTYEPK